MEENVEVKNETKSKKTILIIAIVLVVLLIGIGAGYFLLKGKKLDNNETEIKENKNSEIKEEKNEEPTEEKSTKTYEVKEDNNPHSSCELCVQDGGICCNTDGVAADYLKVSADSDLTTSEVSIKRLDNEHRVKFSKTGERETILIDDVNVFTEHSTVDNVFILDNGMMGIEYHDDSNQNNKKKRNYYNKNNQLYMSIEGIDPSVDLFAKKFDYIVKGKQCIDNSYREDKVYTLYILDDTMESTYVKTIKTNNCDDMS